MDKPKAVSSFLAHIEDLSRLPLVTDDEMRQLYGDEVMAALAEMERFEHESHVCAQCRGRCCSAVRCELYAPRFGRCPIHDFRPIICRLHFCDRFPIAASPLMRELDDIFFEGLLAAQDADIQQAHFVDCPPFTRIAPDIIAMISPLVEAVRNGSLPPEGAEKLIHERAEGYRVSRITY